MAFNGMIELNNAKRDSDLSAGKINAKSPIVEIFSYMAKGKNLSELNSRLKDSAGRPVNVDDGVNYIKELARQAGGGNAYAAVELNELRTFAIAPRLLEELKLLSWMGAYTPVGFNDTIYGQTKKLVGDKTRVQAGSGDVPFSAWEYDKYPVPTVTISGGYQVDYRKIIGGDLTDEAVGMEQTKIDLRNKAAQYVIYTIWNAISNSTDVKFIAQGAGITKTALDEIIRSIRRFGSVGIFGDYSVASQINGFQGYEGVTPTVTGMSEEAMNELRRTGLIGMYTGAVVSEIQNGYNMTKALPDGSGWDTYFPQGLLFVIPNGVESPVRTWTRGSLTSFSGNEIQTGRILSRFDIEIAADVGRGEEYKIGMIYDNTWGPIVAPR